MYCNKQEKQQIHFSLNNCLFILCKKNNYKQMYIFIQIIDCLYIFFYLHSLTLFVRIHSPHVFCRTLSQYYTFQSTSWLRHQTGHFLDEVLDRALSVWSIRPGPFLLGHQLGHFLAGALVRAVRNVLLLSQKLSK